MIDVEWSDRFPMPSTSLALSLGMPYIYNLDLKYNEIRLNMLRNISIHDQRQPRKAESKKNLRLS